MLVSQSNSKYYTPSTVDTHAYNLYIVCITMLYEEHWSSKLSVSSFGKSATTEASSQTCLHIPKYSHWREMKRCSRRRRGEEGWGGEGGGGLAKNRGCRTDSQAGTGMAVVLRKCSSHYSAFH